MFDFIREKFQLLPTMPKRKIVEIYRQLEKKYPPGEDPWGLNIKKAKTNTQLVWPFYKHYFQVKVHGHKQLEDKPYMVTSNHTGQIPIDAVLVSEAFQVDVKPPRILRAMIERFVPSLPFLSTLFAESGAVLGDRTNCLNLLKRGESILVFPEGVRGVSKSTSDYYKVQSFTKGFFRLALSTKTDILPVAVVGAEEFYPFVYQAKSIAKLFGLPALPLSPTYLLGPVAAIPLPSPVDIYIAEPYKIPHDLSPDAPDREINEHVYKIEQIIQQMIADGLKNRRKFFASKYLPDFKDHMKGGR